MSWSSRNNKTESEGLKTTARADELSWEVFKNDLIEKSERKAWNVAKVSCGLVVILCLAIFLMLPLKTTEPFVVQVDKSTGLTEILHIANTSDIPSSEIMDKYWVSQFIYAHENYDWNTLNDDIEKVRQLAVPEVYDSYVTQFNGQNGEKSIERKLQNKYRVVVQIKSIVINSVNSGVEKVATVRFSKKTIKNDSGLEVGSNSWTANIAYEYYPEFDSVESARLVNPFGFKVLSYRVDPELSE